MQNSPMYNPQFQNINPEKMRFLAELFNEMNGKDMDQKIQLLMSFGIRMKQANLQFTQQESQVIIEFMKQNLNPAERSKLDMLQQMMQMMS